MLTEDDNNDDDDKNNICSNDVKGHFHTYGYLHTRHRKAIVYMVHNSVHYSASTGMKFAKLFPQKRRAM